MSEPIPMRITCPECGTLHIDEGEFATKVHHTHTCQKCGLTWRPAVVPTVGVRFLPGFKNDGAKAMNSPATVQRYELTSHGQYSMRYESLDEDPNGDWVKWEDHCRALEAVLRQYSNDVVRIRQRLGDVKWRDAGHHCESKSAVHAVIQITKDIEARIIPQLETRP